jgi:hypothetical protein
MALCTTPDREAGEPSRLQLTSLACQPIVQLLMQALASQLFSPLQYPNLRRFSSSAPVSPSRYHER